MLSDLQSFHIDRRAFGAESGHLRTQGMRVDYVKKPLNGQQGYNDLAIANDGRWFDVQPHQINGGSTVYNRVRYCG
jgi:hypothetical protein